MVAVRGEESEDTRELVVSEMTSNIYIQYIYGLLLSVFFFLLHFLFWGVFFYIIIG